MKIFSFTGHSGSKKYTDHKVRTEVVYLHDCGKCDGPKDISYILPVNSNFSCNEAEKSDPFKLFSSTSKWFCKIFLKKQM